MFEKIIPSIEPYINEESDIYKALYLLLVFFGTLCHYISTAVPVSFVFN